MSASTTDAFDGEGVSLIFTTIARNRCVRRLVDSALGCYPALKVLVADQNPPSAEMNAFYRDRGVGIHWVPFDFGVSAGRAELARNVETPFVIYGDDDFVFTPRTRIAPVMEYLLARPEVALVTGGMIDQQPGLDGKINRFRRRYETYMYRDVANKGLIAVPIDYVQPVVDVHNGNVFYSCDLGLNWAMARTSLFADGRFLWDPQFKTGGEHENFFLQIKEFGGGRVMFYPDMECDHAPETHPDYEILRSRDAGWEAFGAKWGVDWILHVGSCFQRYDDFSGSVISMASGGYGSSPQIPPRPHDYLRVWANGSAAASVSMRPILKETNERLRDLRADSQQRIQALRARIEVSETSNKRMTERLEELRARLKGGATEPSAPPASSEPAPDTEALAEARRQNRKLLDRIAQLEAEASLAAFPPGSPGKAIDPAVYAELRQNNLKFRERIAFLEAANAAHRETIRNLRKPPEERAEGERVASNS